MARLQGAWAALFLQAPGTPVPRVALCRNTASALGAFLAQGHSRLPLEVPFAVPAVDAASVECTTKRLQSIEPAILALAVPDGVDRWALTRARQRLEHLRSGPLHDCTPTLPSRFLNGDHHDGNVFFLRGRSVSLIDWEQTRRAPRAWEIVRTLDLSLRLQPEMCQAFLSAYRASSSLSHAEPDEGAQFYATLQERNVWTYESVYLEGNPGPRRFIRPPPYVPFLTRWPTLMA